MPEVSIVLPVYNGEKYLAESIESVIAQSYNDWELIIVDDCSTDRTSSIVQGYANKDSRIKVIRNQTNQKLPRSLNIGFAHAKGRFLTWTSDDNVYLLTAIEEMYTYMNDNTECPMVVADMCMFDDMTGKENYLSYNEKNIYVYNCVGACFLYKSSVREKIGNYAPEMFLVEDYDYWLRILFEVGDIGHIPQCLYRYRYHPDSLTTTRKADVKRQVIKLRQRYVDNIIAKLYDHKDLLARIYYELLGVDDDTTDALIKIKQALPQLERDVLYDDNRTYVIFGAGEFGDKAWKSLGEQVVAYVDSNPDKIGKEKNGLSIYDVEELDQISENSHVMIACDVRKVFEMIKKLEGIGVPEFCTWLNYEAHNK